MTTPYTRFLDWRLGPRDWAVVRVWNGAAFAVHESRIDADDLIIRAGLRRGAALRIARHLRQKAEDTPEAVI